MRIVLTDIMPDGSIQAHAKSRTWEAFLLFSSADEFNEFVSEEDVVLSEFQEDLCDTSCYHYAHGTCPYDYRVRFAECPRYKYRNVTD